SLKVEIDVQKVPEIHIQMLPDEGDEKKERLRVAEEKRRRNVMPPWITNSTISSENNTSHTLANLDARSNAIGSRQPGNDAV
ncbi:5619_t:CDS:1, partial [Acaulospora colombiana]